MMRTGEPIVYTVSAVTMGAGTMEAATGPSLSIGLIIGAGGLLIGLLQYLTSAYYQKRRDAREERELAHKISQTQKQATL